MRDRKIARPDQVWGADVTYILLHRGFMYLIAIMHWYSRRVLTWRLPKTLDANFCIDALGEAIERFGHTEIFNTDQGCQCTSVKFTHILNDNGIRISMHGKGRWTDNVFIERLWRPLKCEYVYLRPSSHPAM